jgi:hypothetical protein
MFHFKLDVARGRKSWKNSEEANGGCAVIERLMSESLRSLQPPQNHALSTVRCTGRGQALEDLSLVQHSEGRNKQLG